MWRFNPTVRSPLLSLDFSYDNLVYLALARSYLQTEELLDRRGSAPLGISEGITHIALGRQMGHTSALVKLFSDNVDKCVFVTRGGTEVSNVWSCLGFRSNRVMSYEQFSRNDWSIGMRKDYAPIILSDLYSFVNVATQDSFVRAIKELEQVGMVRQVLMVG